VSKSLVLPALLLVAALSTGCSINAPRYASNIAGVTELKGASLAPVKVAEAAKTDRKKQTERLTIRGSSYNSPYGSFEAYLASALKEDLAQAGLLADQSDTQVHTTLVRNELDGSGFSQGYAEIEARFEVRRGGNVVYDKTKVARQEWPSSFVGAVAIPRAAQNYPPAVGKLLGSLYSDPEFIAALKKR
jgi:hypothetical protein